jgi:hypothetical protein
MLTLAAEVEHWPGPTGGAAGFHDPLHRHTRRGTALVAVDPGSEVLGGLLVGTPPVYRGS